jgi:hypothetical protein
MASKGKSAAAPERRRLEDLAPDTGQLMVAAVGALLVGVLYLALPDALSVGPSWLLLLVEAVLLAPILVETVILRRRRRLPYAVVRTLALALLGVLAVTLVGTVALLVGHISAFKNGGQLLAPAALLWGMNVLVFAFLYWELDGGGPRRRLRAGHEAADFLFPQQLGGNRTRWAPGFVDYLFLAFCFATALSPADTPPLTRRGKLLMMAEAVISLLVIVLLVARSVNILS